VTGLVAHPIGDPLDRILEAIPAQPDHPYDLIFAWDVLDWIHPEHREPLVDRIVKVAAPDARLHAVVAATDKTVARPLRFALLDTDRMRFEPTGPVRPVLPRLLPAQLGHLLEPFRVVRGYTLKGDLREYVAVRGGE
jgi:hypothetical protein